MKILNKIKCLLGLHEYRIMFIDDNNPNKKYFVKYCLNCFKYVISFKEEKILAKKDVFGKHIDEVVVKQKLLTEEEINLLLNV